MLIGFAQLIYAPTLLPSWLTLFILGVASGAAMIPYTIIKEVNPDHVKGSATGAINFLVFTLSALVAPGYGWLLNRFAGGGKLTLLVFQHASSFGIAGIAAAIIISVFIRETGRVATPSVQTGKSPI